MIKALYELQHPKKEPKKKILIIKKKNTKPHYKITINNNKIVDIQKK